ncbi:hypothetical protein HanRHA438_Chr12g0542231 [Helianthus annuus]|nr:hypothetical protein HanRHA438_Chr12g0542231 [Helianthus annuus]
MIMLVSFGRNPISGKSFHIHKTSTNLRAIPLNSISALERTTASFFIAPCNKIATHKGRAES